MSGPQRATLIEPRSRRSPPGGLGERAVDNPIRIGLIGLGPRARGNVVAKTIRYADYELVAVCDRRAGLAAQVAADIERDHQHVVRHYADAEKMLAAEELDAVAVLVDPDQQIPVACAALEGGCHVMCEVPLTYSLAHCWQAVVTVERTGKQLFLMEQLRYSGYVRAWRKIVDQGVIGKPLFVEGEYFSCKGGDVLFQDADGVYYTPEQAARYPERGPTPTWRHTTPAIGYLPHELSPMLYVIDDRVTRVVGMSTRQQSYRYPTAAKADIQVALMHTAKDVVLRMAVGHTSSAMPRRVGAGESAHWHHVKGSHGVLELGRTPGEKPKMWVEDWDMGAPLSVEWSEARHHDPPEVAATGHGGQGDHGGRDYYAFAAFADTVLRGEPLEMDVYTGVETAAPAAAAIASIEQGSAPQSVPDFRPGPHRKAGELPAGVTI